MGVRARRACPTRNRPLSNPKTLVMNEGRPGGRSTTFDDGEKRAHQLDGISRPYRVTCPEGFGLRLEDGKRVIEQIQRAILCDQVEEIIRESRVCPTYASVRAIYDYRKRVLDTLFGRLAVKAARLGHFSCDVRSAAMPGDPFFSAGVFLSRPGYPGVAAAPCRAWVPAFLSRGRAADEKFPPLPPAPSHHGA